MPWIGVAVLADLSVKTRLFRWRFSDTFALNQPGRKQMTSDKAQRDALNNQRFKDIYIHASQEPWIEFYPGIGFKLLRATQETGHWTVLLNCAKGSSIPRHEHLGAGEYYVISGKMEVRGGVENGGITA